MDDLSKETVLPQEEPQFQNVSMIDRDLYFEAIRVRDRGWRSKMFIALGAVIAVVGLLMGRPVIAVLGVVIAVCRILSPVLIGYRDYGKLLELHPEGSWTKHLRFYPDRIESDSGTGEPTVLRYGDITRVSESERLYILEFGKTAPATLFRKDSFTQGSMEELEPYLLERQREKYAEDKPTA